MVYVEKLFGIIYYLAFTEKKVEEGGGEGEKGEKKRTGGENILERGGGKGVGGEGGKKKGRGKGGERGRRNILVRLEERGKDG